jgi:hypothetical protein
MASGGQPDHLQELFGRPAAATTAMTTKQELEQKRIELQALTEKYAQEKAEQRRLEREAARKKEDTEIEQCKAHLAKHHEIPRDKKFDKAWDIAWDQGHSSGLEEVVQYFDQLADLIKP